MMDFNCNDFGTANPEHVIGDFTAAAYRVADALRLPNLDANKFAQGYIHACQGRDDLLAIGSAVYDAGHAAGSVAS